MSNRFFLRQVASYYSRRGDLSGLCLVFPNRRSSQFFLKSLEQELGSAVSVLPQVSTIAEFVADLSQGVAISGIEALFTLYECYCSLSPANAAEVDFNKFVYWGNIVLKDFDEVDMQLVDARVLFSNLKDLREIRTDYLSDELKDKLEYFFDTNFNRQSVSEEDRDFWTERKHSTVEADFIALWESLYELYEAYNESLESRGLSGRGRMYRTAAKRVKDLYAEEMPYERYAFVGFSMLTASEMSIFGSLKKKGIANFFWDTASPALSDKSNVGARFVDLYAEDYRMPADFTLDEIDTWPQITSVGVPSNIGQAKYAFNMISRGQVTYDAQETDTAIVLADENLLPAVLNSIGRGVKEVNITMSYPLRNSEISGLMHMVARLHSQATLQSDKSGGRAWHFYREDVKDVLSHTLIKSYFGKEALRISTAIDNSTIFQVPSSLLTQGALKPLFRSVSGHETEELTQYIDNLIEFTDSLLTLSRESESAASDTADDDADAEEKPYTLQQTFMLQYIQVLIQVRDAIASHNVTMNQDTVFYLIERLASLPGVAFEGEPLYGLQIMGMLETRLLDFKTLIILSGNERVFPRKSRSTSFISDSLRRYYLMSTSDHQESLWAYNFYRLISRAENVYLLYDSSTQAIGSGEPSRYLAQLEKIYHRPIRRIQVNSVVFPATTPSIRIDKSAYADRISAYSTEGSGRLLSASSINTLINCPLRFYFQHIEHLNAEDNDQEFMGYGTFGTIVHDTLQSLYYPAGTEGKYKVTRKQISEFKKNRLSEELHRNINRLYHHHDAEHLDEPLYGEGLILMEALQIYAKRALNLDLNELTGGDEDFIMVYECERDHELTFRFDDGTAFNFTFKPDRVDCLRDSGPLRMIDYKTGNDVTNFVSIDDMFNSEKGGCRAHAILQLFLYCNAYAQDESISDKYVGDAIKPIIYKLKKVEESGVYYGTSKAKKAIEDYRTQSLRDGTSANEGFLSRLKETITRFLNIEEPFMQTANENNCKYCNFKDFCRRK